MDKLMGRYDSIEELSAFDTPAFSSQGITFDDDHVYVTDNTKLYKYTKAGSLVSSRDISSDGSMDHIGDLVYHNGTLYITTNNYPSSPANGYVAEYDPSDLSFITETQLYSDEGLTTIAYHDGWFWLMGSAGNVKQWPTDLSGEEAVHELDFAQTGQHPWQGIEWYGDSIIVTPHYGTHPNSAQQFWWSGSEFQFMQNMTKPVDCTQGLQYDASEDRLWMVRRDQNSASDGVVFCKLVGDDHRSKAVNIEMQVGTTLDTSSTSYVEEPNHKVQVRVKKNDIIRVELTGIFRTSGPNGVRAYMYEASTNNISLSLLKGAPTLRASCSKSEGTTLSGPIYWRANEDGVATFSMFWRTVGSGTVYTKDRLITAQVVGHYTEPVT